jgi:hypothetical protein
VGCDRTLGESDPRLGVGERRNAQAGGLISRAAGPKKTRGSCRAFFLLTSSAREERAPQNEVGVCLAMSRSRHHQHVEDNDRRQGQDRRPDAERPNNVFGAKVLLFRDWFVLGIHDDAPAFLVLWILDTGRILKSRPQIRAHLSTGATAD